MRVRMERSGWCVFSSTMEEVPGDVGKLVSFGSGGEVYEVVTEFDDDGELARQLAHVDGHYGRMIEKGSEPAQLSCEYVNIRSLYAAIHDSFKPNIPTSHVHVQ
jgi:hypothetical protein